MSRQSVVAAAVATVLGATLGGLLFWRTLRVQKKRLPEGQAKPDSVVKDQQNMVQQNNEVVSALPPPSLSPPPKSLATPPPSADQLLGVRPAVVSSEAEWEQLRPSLEKDLSVFPVLGLDCEWVKTPLRVSVKGKASAVSLLQMASYTGFCVLVRLHQVRSPDEPLPCSLATILGDPRILKVGVGCYDDAKRLARDHGLALKCTVDLRYLVLRQRKMGLSNGLSLKSLAADLLNVPLDKSLELRCSDWEADQLTLDQVTYAAKDAQVSIALFFHLLGPSSTPSPALNTEEVFTQLSSYCEGLLDVPFRGREEATPDGERRRRSTRATSESPGSGDQQVPDPRKNKRKALGVGYSARKSPLYDNCFLHAPDGQLLCTCDKKKAKWYLDKGIGELLSEDPFIVRLKFEPSGRPDSQQDYYLTAKENLCVVCGKTDSYIRKNVVPHEYRRHFPSEMKDHNSHDILLLCTYCHAASNVHDGVLKQRLAEEFAAPLGCEEGVRQLEDADRRRVRSAARALLTAGDGLPGSRRLELEGVVRSFFGEEQQEVTAEMVQRAANLKTRIFNQNYVPHGLKVVQAYAQGGLCGLMELERRWRQHFLSTMKPRHLHPLWSVNHNHAKFLRKYGEDLPIKLN